MQNTLRALLRWLLQKLYAVEVHGLEYFEAAGDRILIVANHTSFLDAALLAVFLPDRLTFAVNTYIAQAWWVKPLLSLVEFFPMDPTNPLSTKSLIKRLQRPGKAVIFPEGRITVTGSLMKIYQGPGLVADRSGAMLLPVRIDGAQYTVFSRLRGRVRLRWFPKITLTLLPPRRLAVPDEIKGRARRARAGQLLSDVMTEMVFETSQNRRTLFQALLDARKVHGGDHPIAEDTERRVVSYNDLFAKIFALGAPLEKRTRRDQNVGVLLPSAVSTVATFFALHLYARAPAMLNFTVGAQPLLSAIRTAKIDTVITSKRFVAVAKLNSVVQTLSESVKVVYLEDIAANLGVLNKMLAYCKARAAGTFYNRYARRAKPGDPAVVLFTSGSEGTPKGVVLSHSNLMANRLQMAARVDFGSQDVILNTLPLFHSFGLMAGTLLPLLSGMRVFFYPSPLHYRIVPEVAYDINATILFGTNTFLAGYARFAHPYDFYSIRYVFAGAEKLQEQTRAVWAEKFGIRIFEGYGATETSPVLATNTPMDNRAGTVGRLMPGVTFHLEEVPGVAEGGRLYVKGPNVMSGYLLADRPGELVAPRSEHGEGWYDTGDIVNIDDGGFITICGRAKRFAKIGGEMVSLTAVEQYAAQLWPQAQHAVVSVPDSQKGEMLVLMTSQTDANRPSLADQAKRSGYTELSVPKKIIVRKQLPLLGTGKIDYVSARSEAAGELGIPL